VLEGRDFGEHGIACSGQLQHLRARNGAAHQGGRHRAPGVVRELEGLTKHGAGFRHRPGPETLEDLGAQPFEARLRGESVERRQRKFLDTLREVWSKNASRGYRPGVHPHHSLHKLRVPVQHEADGKVGPTVSDDDRGLILGFREPIEDLQDGCGLIVESLRRTLRIVSVETGQGHRECPSVVAFQVVEDVIPGPCAQPVTGDENDGGTARCSCHVTTFLGASGRCVSLFVS
jgi:hypothetical protein